MHFPGELIITGIDGKKLLQKEKELIQKEKIGGIILFSKNYETPEQLGELVNELQALRDEYPLFISVDQEGGRVQRFKNKFTFFPPMFDIAKKNSPKFCYEVFCALSQELKACGVNLNFAPVCDIWSEPQNKVIGDRAFGDEPLEVEKYVSAAIRGLQTNGLLSCAKHFPGHGNTLLDSHYDLPIVKKGLEEIREFELIPFRKAVKSRVEMIMMSHIIYESIDPELPCSLSPKAYQFLREELKYQRIIITDDLQMQALTKFYTEEEIAINTLIAGADILIYRDFDKTMTAIDAIRQAIKTKKISNLDIETKIKRIQSCKKKYFENYKPLYIPDINSQMGTHQHQQLIKSSKLV